MGRGPEAFLVPAAVRHWKYPWYLLQECRHRCQVLSEALLPTPSVLCVPLPDLLNQRAHLYLRAPEIPADVVPAQLLILMMKEQTVKGFYAALLFFPELMSLLIEACLPAARPAPAEAAPAAERYRGRGEEHHLQRSVQHCPRG